jgi:hypothetical protein
MNPAVYADPQVIPQTVPPRRRGRPTLYCPELVEEFCGLIVDGLTIGEVVEKLGGPDQRTIKRWFKKYPEFRKEYEESVAFRNECWLDDNVDIAMDVTGAPTADRKLICDQRWKRYNGMGLKGLQPQAGDSAKPVGERKIVEHDPVHGLLYQWEIAYQKRQRERANHANEPGHAGNGQRR